ncbi:MAG TPA: 4-alpha-glucanotransferase [Planctomycetaceae bacterium]|mgnify:CR=1 FL=1|nr:4-alpha-glucanotransferase [Planctomycetaceae bacterium]
MMFPRSSGVLLPIFSLPARFGMGDMGPAALEFLELLHAGGQSIWQVLPPGPVAQGNSPYSTYSAFAGNPLLISPEFLLRDGLISVELLQEQDLDRTAQRENRVCYDSRRTNMEQVLKFALETFRSQGDSELARQFQQFREENSHWLTDFALFETLSLQYQTSDWTLWPDKLASRDQEEILAVTRDWSDDIESSEFRQFLFHKQWQDVRSRAAELGIKIYGDMPIFVAADSVDVWTHQEEFFLDDRGRPTVVAGVPPDYFSETGQKWGNPLYRWDRMAENGYQWWKARFQKALQDFDILRLDHFRGFESYWEVPAEAETAIDGVWKAGPGDSLFQAVFDDPAAMPIVAEDLGLITDEVHGLRDRLAFPGMRVMQFGFDSHDDRFHRPDSYPEHCFAYTGTHDNDTSMGWLIGRREAGTTHVLDDFIHSSDRPEHWEMVELVLNSNANTAIIPLQDLLGYDSSARINVPGEPTGNWAWQCPASVFSKDVVQQLRSLTETARRLPQQA